MLTNSTAPQNRAYITWKDKKESDVKSSSFPVQFRPAGLSALSTRLCPEESIDVSPFPDRVSKIFVKAPKVIRQTLPVLQTSPFCTLLYLLLGRF